MEKWVLAVGYDPIKFGKPQTEWIKQGLLIHPVNSVDEAAAVLTTRQYVLIAICSDKQDSLMFLAWLRRQTSVPVVILSPQNNASEREESIRLGAAAYIPWSGSVEQTIEIGRRVLRSYHAAPPPPKRAGAPLAHKSLVMCADYHKVLVQGKEVRLTHKEFAILRYLLENRGLILSHSQIYAHVWDAPLVKQGGTGIWNHIKSIRAKLAAQLPEAADYIRNVHGVGYTIDKE